MYTTFIQDRENAGLFAAFAYDINVYFIPMFTGAKRVASNAGRDNAKKGLDYRLHPLVLFYVGGLDEYRKSLEFDGKNKPYFFLLDEEGTIVWAGSGNVHRPSLKWETGFFMAVYHTSHWNNYIFYSLVSIGAANPKNCCNYFLLHPSMSLDYSHALKTAKNRLFL